MSKKKKVKKFGGSTAVEIELRDRASRYGQPTPGGRDLIFAELREKLRSIGYTGEMNAESVMEAFAMRFKGIALYIRCLEKGKWMADVATFTKLTNQIPSCFGHSAFEAAARAYIGQTI